MFLGIQNGKVKFYTEKPLNKTLYCLDEVIETRDIYTLNGDEYVLVDEEYKKEELERKKEEKYKEALEGAKDYISSGSALYEFEEGKHIEATDGNIGKFSAYALGFISGSIEGAVEWTTKEDEIVELTQEQVSAILLGLGAVQREVWTVKFPRYVEAIDDANTIEEVEEIEINYSEQKAIVEKEHNDR